MLIISIIANREYNLFQKFPPSSKLNEQTENTFNKKKIDTKGLKSTNQCGQWKKIKEVCKDLPNISAPIPANKSKKQLLS